MQKKTMYDIIHCLINEKKIKISLVALFKIICYKFAIDKLSSFLK